MQRLNLRFRLLPHEPEIVLRLKVSEDATVCHNPRPVATDRTPESMRLQDHRPAAGLLARRVKRYSCQAITSTMPSRMVKAVRPREKTCSSL